MRRRWWKGLAIFAPTTLLMSACGLDRLSVGAGAPEGVSGGTGSTQNGVSGGSGDFSGLPNAGASFAGGGKQGAGAGDSAGGRASGGSGMGTAGTSSEAGTNNAGRGGNEANGLVCDPGRADCDGDPANGCEVLLQSALNCGSACGAVVACDVDGSAATCVNSRCTSIWASWIMPNAPTSDPDAPNQAEYVDNGDGTVRDVITGLIWQKANRPGAHDWDEATNYCARLTFAGFSDWRLPDRLELISIEDPSFSRNGVFQYVLQDSGPPPMFWSSTIAYRPDDLAAWFVAGPTHSTRMKTEEMYVRCVR